MNISRQTWRYARIVPTKDAARRALSYQSSRSHARGDCSAFKIADRLELVPEENAFKDYVCLLVTEARALRNHGVRAVPHRWPGLAGADHGRRPPINSKQMLRRPIEAASWEVHAVRIRAPVTGAYVTKLDRREFAQKHAHVQQRALAMRTRISAASVLPNSSPLKSPYASQANSTQISRAAPAAMNAPVARTVLARSEFSCRPNTNATKTARCDKMENTPK